MRHSLVHVKNRAQPTDQALFSTSESPAPTDGHRHQTLAGLPKTTPTTASVQAHPEGGKRVLFFPACTASAKGPPLMASI